MFEPIAPLVILLACVASIGCADRLPSCRDIPSAPVAACVSGPNLQVDGNRSVNASGIITALNNEALSICGGQEGLVIGSLMTNAPVQTIQIKTTDHAVWTLGIAADTRPTLEVGDSVALDAALTFGAFVQDTGHIRLRAENDAILFAVAQAPTLVDVAPWLGLTLQAGTDGCERQDDCGTVIGSSLAVLDAFGEIEIPLGTSAQIGDLLVTNDALYRGRLDRQCADWNPDSVKVAVVASP